MTASSSRDSEFITAAHADCMHDAVHVHVNGAPAPYMYMATYAYRVRALGVPSLHGPCESGGTPE